MSLHQCEIVRVAYEGMGISHIKGKVVFVPDTVKGDIVSIRIIKDLKKYASAEVLGYIKKSPLRKEKTTCAYFGTCGGCQWLDVSYGYQIENKRLFISDALQKITGLSSGFDISFAAPALVENYRSRILLRARVDTQGFVSVGFFKKESHELIAVKSCSLAMASLNKIIEKISKIQLLTLKNAKFRLELQSLDQDLKVIALFYPIGNQSLFTELVEVISSFPEVIWAGFLADRQQAEFCLFEKDRGLSYYSLPGVFQQVNILQNQKLRNQVFDIVVEHKINSLLDLYCGSGNLSLQFARRGIKVTGVEVSKESIDCAHYNLKKNDLLNAQYFAQSVFSFLKFNTSYFECIIIDPPRKGLETKEIELILSLKPKLILYVSCNPNTWARDLKKLLSCYKLKQVTGYDFFPNTYHVELLSTLLLS